MYMRILKRVRLQGKDSRKLHAASFEETAPLFEERVYRLEVHAAALAAINTAHTNGLHSASNTFC